MKSETSLENEAAVVLPPHGFVRLIDHMGDDLSVVRAARVSYDAAWRAGEDEGKDTKLIERMMNSEHGTPFEAVTFTFEVKAPIFIFRQWHRHRTQSYNELSARYKELPDEWYVPDPAMVGVAHSTDKQMRLTGGEMTSGELFTRTNECQFYDQFCRHAFSLYHRLLASGWPRELARGVLPVCTYSHMFTTMNLRNLFGFVKLRLDPHAQHEAQVYAKAMLELVEPLVPASVAAFLEHTGLTPSK